MNNLPMPIRRLFVAFVVRYFRPGQIFRLRCASLKMTNGGGASRHPTNLRLSVRSLDSSPRDRLGMPVRAGPDDADRVLGSFDSLCLLRLFAAKARPASC